MILNNDNKFDYIIKIYFHNLFGFNTLKLKEKEFVTSSSNEKYIKF